MGGIYGKAIDLAGLTKPARLARPARLHGVVVDETGAAGQRHFLADLPAGTAVFSLAAADAVFLLADSDPAADGPALTDGPLDAASVEAWYAALLACPGLPHGDGSALRLEPGQRRASAAGTIVTAHVVVWLRASASVLRYPAAGDVAASPERELLVIGNQIGAEITGDGTIEAIDTATLLADLPGEALGPWSGELARRVGAALVTAETAERHRRQAALSLDEAAAAQSLQRLRDIAAFRRPKIAAATLAAHDPLAAALAVVAEAEGLTLRWPHDDDPGAGLFERLGRFANVTGFRFREIALSGDWWTEEGPAFIAVEATTSRPLGLVWRRGRWRALDSSKGTENETTIDGTAAAALSGRGYMLYPALPEQVTTRELLRFAAFGVHGDIAWLLAASLAAMLAGLLLPVTTGAILGTAIPQGRMTLLSDMLLLLGASALGGAGFQVARALALIRLGTQIDRRLQPAVWDRVVRLRASFFRDYPVGDLALRILGIDTVRRILSGVAVSGAISGVFSLASLGLMLVYDASLTAFAAAYAVVAALLIFTLGRLQMRLERIVYQRKGIVSGLLIELLDGIAKLRIAAAELRAFARWSEAFAGQRVHSARSGRLAGFQTVLATSLPIAGAICIFGISAGGPDPIDVGTFAAFNSAFGQFTAALLGFASALNTGIEAVPLLARVRPVLEAPLEVEENRADPGPLGGQIAVRGLSFRYSPEGPWILDDVSFEARPGESVAIVGASGSGKSTLLRLLLGFETPARGGVYYDDRDLEKLDLRLVRRQIGTVLETSRLVPGSLRDNIAGIAPLSRDAVEEAVRQAGLDSDVAALPMGLETFVSEGSGTLSGGQRQRVMIARALAHKPRLLFFDEATSALDNRTQAIVGRSVAATNATRLVIAHRLSTIRHADRILVLERGRIVESGTYEALMGRRGAFHRLAQRQLL